MPRRKKKPQRRPRGSGTITKLRDGSYRALTPRDAENHRDSHRCTSWDEAAKWLDDWLQEQERRRRPTPDSGLLGDYLAAWFANRDQNWREGTRRGYAYAMRRIEPLANVPLAELTVEQCQGWINGMLGRGLALNTVQKSRALVLGALNRAVPSRIPFNPMLSTELPRRRLRQKQTVWDEHQAARFLQQARGHRHEPLYLLALSCGLRFGELMGLRWEDLRLATGTLLIGRSLGDRKVRAEPGLTKSGLERTLDLPPLALVALKAQRLRVSPAARYIFTNPKTGHPWSRRTVVSDFQKLMRAAGVPRLRVHDLRHSAACLLIIDGLPPTDVANMLGHANPGITLSLYSQSFESQRQRAAQAMEKVLQRALSGEKVTGMVASDADS
jgi:integrase